MGTTRRSTDSSPVPEYVARVVATMRGYAAVHLNGLVQGFVAELARIADLGEWSWPAGPREAGNVRYAGLTVHGLADLLGNAREDVSNGIVLARAAGMAERLTVADAKAFGVLAPITATRPAAVELRVWLRDNGIDPDTPDAMRATVPHIRKHLRKPGLVSGSKCWQAATNYSAELANRMTALGDAMATQAAAVATADTASKPDRKAARTAVTAASKDVATVTATLPTGHGAKAARDSIATTAIKSAGLPVTRGPRSKAPKAGKPEALAALTLAAGKCYAAKASAADVAGAMAAADATADRATWDINVGGHLIARRVALVDSPDNPVGLTATVLACVPGLSDPDES